MRRRCEMLEVVLSGENRETSKIYKMSETREQRKKMKEG